jgi:hypothetical protein
MSFVARLPACHGIPIGNSTEPLIETSGWWSLIKKLSKVRSTGNAFAMDCRHGINACGKIGRVEQEARVDNCQQSELAFEVPFLSRLH